jgi:plasmid maintenance system antidote protein VapI
MTKTHTHPFCPDWGSPPPGATIADLMKKRGWNPSELADRLQCTEDFVNSLLSGETLVTSELAVKLENVLENTAEFWLKQEALYRSDLELERQSILYTSQMLAALQHQIRQFHRRELVNFKPDYLQKLTQKIAHKATAIQNNWTTLSPDEKESWRKLACEIIDAEPTSFFWRMRASAYLILLRAIGQKKTFDECVLALDCLVDAILNAIKRENPGYEMTIAISGYTYDLENLVKRYSTTLNRLSTRAKKKLEQ